MSSPPRRPGTATLPAPLCPVLLTFFPLPLYYFSLFSFYCGTALPPPPTSPRFASRPSMRFHVFLDFPRIFLSSLRPLRPCAPALKSPSRSPPAPRAAARASAFHPLPSRFSMSAKRLSRFSMSPPPRLRPSVSSAFATSPFPPFVAQIPPPFTFLFSLFTAAPRAARHQFSNDWNPVSAFFQ